MDDFSVVLTGTIHRLDEDGNALAVLGSSAAGRFGGVLLYS